MKKTKTNQPEKNIKDRKMLKIEQMKDILSDLLLRD